MHSLDVRHGSFETRIVGELILSRADSVATSLKPVATEPNDPHIFPNPVGNILHIDTGTREYDKYAILDLQGRILHSGILPSSYQLDISWLPTGNYLLRCLSTRKGSSTLVKFVKG